MKNSLYYFFALIFFVLLTGQANGDCVEIVTDKAIIYKAPARGSLALGVVRSGKVYAVKGRMRNMIKIHFRRQSGWIDKRDVRYLDCPDSLISQAPPLDDQSDVHPVRHWIVTNKDLSAIIIIGFLALCITAIIVFLDFRPRRHTKARFLLIVGDPAFPILDKNQTTIALAQHCARAGFMFTDVHSMERLKRHLTYYVPDVILVDWNLEPGIFENTESLLLEICSSDSVLVIAYNVPGDQMTHLRSALSHYHFFTSTPASRELDQIITTFLQTRGQRNTIRIRRTVQEIALQGEIAEGSIADILQMVEMGSKSGLLQVNDTQPLGQIGFEGGMITFAVTRSGKEREAVYTMLDLAAGTFRFEADTAPRQRNCMIAVMEILMTWAQKKDEEHR